MYGDIAPSFVKPAARRRPFVHVAAARNAYLTRIHSSIKAINSVHATKLRRVIVPLWLLFVARLFDDSVFECYRTSEGSESAKWPGSISVVSAKC